MFGSELDLSWEKDMKRIFSLGTAFVLGGLASAQVSTLSGFATVDNAIKAYLSTSPTSLGTEFITGADWQQTFSGSINIPAGGTYYLHIRGVDFGLPAMFIGDFTLSGSNAVFAKTGTNKILSSIDNFDASGGAFPGDQVATAFDRGGNTGSSTWGPRPNIDGAARFIWARNAAGAEFSGSDNPVYFTTAIRAVPEPATCAVLGLGVAALLRRRKG